jgi:Apea-like HEPN
VSANDAAWVAEHFETFNHLASKSEPFRLALEAAIDWRFAKEPRLAVGRLWSGIEAVFGVTSELVYRISILCASLLEERGRPRKARFEAVKKLYGLRSKAVHGEPLSENQLVSAMNDSNRLLRQLLLLTIEKGHVLGGEDFDDALFG